MRSVEPSHQPPITIIPQKKQIYFDNRKNLKFFVFLHLLPINALYKKLFFSIRNPHKSHR